MADPATSSHEALFIVACTDLEGNGDFATVLLKTPDPVDDPDSAFECIGRVRRVMREEARDQYEEPYVVFLPGTAPHSALLPLASHLEPYRDPLD